MIGSDGSAVLIQHCEGKFTFFGPVTISGAFN